MVDHKAEFNIRVLNLSVASDTQQSYKTDPLDAAVEYAWQKGIVVVAASGNRGAAPDAVKYSPGNDPFVISVGGIDEDANYGRGKRADWSSTGRTQDGFAKPDVMAPGAHIVSVLAPSSAFLTLCPNCSIGGAYFKAGGTSMAAPVVAGAAALLLQARPTLTPDQVKTLLTQTDKPISGQAGAGKIDVERALFTPVELHQRQPRPGAEPADPGAQPRRRRPRPAGRAPRGAARRARWPPAGPARAGPATAATARRRPIDPTRSSWSRSSWSSAGEDASAEAAAYEAAIDAQEQAAAAEDTLGHAGPGRRGPAGRRGRAAAGAQPPAPSVGGRRMSRPRDRASWGRKQRP